jgi:Ricin-type beta-trefoil lectin domain
MKSRSRLADSGKVAISRRMTVVAALACAITSTGGAAYSEAGSATPAASSAANIRIMNAQDAQCLVVRGYAEGTPAVETGCASFADQYWSLDPVPGQTSHQVRNVNSNKCLVARGGAGDRVVQTQCAPYADQYWYQVATWEGFRLRNQHSNLCMEGEGNEAAVRVWTCDTSVVAQSWLRTP